MAATAKAAPDLKRLAGGARGGRKLAKPVLHYSLSWAQDETPTRPEMSRAGGWEPRGAGTGGPRGADSSRTTTPGIPTSTWSPTGSIQRPGRRRSWGTASFGCRAGPRATSGARAGSGSRDGSRTTSGGARARRCFAPYGTGRFTGRASRREGMERGRTRRATPPGDEDRVDMDCVAACRNAGLGEGRGRALAGVLAARNHSAEGMGRAAQAAGGQSAEALSGRAAPCSVGSGFGGLSARCGSWSGRSGAGRTWSRAGARDLDRYHKGERAALGKAHADSARQIEREVREAYRKVLRDAEQRAREVREREVDMGARARPEHHPHCAAAAPAPGPRAWRGRVRAMTFDVVRWPSRRDDSTCSRVGGRSWRHGRTHLRGRR